MKKKKAVGKKVYTDKEAKAQEKEEREELAQKMATERSMGRY